MIICSTIKWYIEATNAHQRSSSRAKILKIDILKNTLRQETFTCYIVNQMKKGNNTSKVTFLDEVWKQKRIA